MEKNLPSSLYHLATGDTNALRIHLAGLDIGKGSNHGVHADIAGKRHGSEAIPLVDAAPVEAGKKRTGEVVRDIGDVQPDIAEGGDDEVVVVREGALEQVEADAACVAKDVLDLVGAGGVRDRHGEGIRQNGEDVLGVVEGHAGAAVRVGNAAVQLA